MQADVEFGDAHFALECLANLKRIQQHFRGNVQVAQMFAKTAVTKSAWPLPAFVAKTLHKGFSRLATSVLNHPCVYIMILVLLVIFSGVSIFVLLESETESSELWNPIDMKGYKEMKRYKADFLEKPKGTAVLYYPTAAGVDILTKEFLYGLLDAHELVDTEGRFQELCHRPSEKWPCPRQSILAVWGYNRDIVISDPDLHVTLTVFMNDDSLRGNGSYLKDFVNVERSDSGKVISLLACKDAWAYSPADKSTLSNVEDTIINYFNSDFKVPGVNAAVFASSSINKELERVVNQDVALVAVSIFLVIIFCSVVLGDLTLVGSRLLLGAIGCFFMLLAFGIGLGCLGLVGEKMTPITPLVLFVLIGIGVDDIIIIVDCYNNHFHLSDRKTRMSKSLGVSGPPITLTTVTDIIAFAVGATATMPAVRSFTIVAFLVICWDFYIQVTVFLIALDLDERRIRSNRIDVLFCIVLPDRYTTAKEFLGCDKQLLIDTKATANKISVVPLPLLPPSKENGIEENDNTEIPEIINTISEEGDHVIHSLDSDGPKEDQIVLRHCGPRLSLRQESLGLEVPSSRIRRKSVLTGKPVSRSDLLKCITGDKLGAPTSTQRQTTPCTTEEVSGDGLISVDSDSDHSGSDDEGSDLNSQESASYVKVLNNTLNNYQNIFQIIKSD